MVSLATIDLYWRWKANVDEQQRDVSHYIMGVSCIARVCQGVMTVPVARITDAIKLHRLWIHQVPFFSRFAEEKGVLKYTSFVSPAISSKDARNGF